MVDDTDFQKPFLKWVGGKTQILSSLIEKFPKEMENYHEIFLGGGSVLFAVLTLQKEGKIQIKNKIYASDVNKNLIEVYKNIQRDKDKFYEHLTVYLNEFKNIEGNEINRKPQKLEEAKTSRESYYYWLRKKFNEEDLDSCEKSVIFLILNKTCFRGIYREGPNGFNVPYGHYKNFPTVMTKEELENTSRLIKDVIFTTCDFTESFSKIEKGDFVYLDPPYAPENKKSFVGYVKDGFNLEKHNLLFSVIKEKENIKFVMSNSKVKLVLDNFQNYSFEDIVARRAINSKDPSSKTTEVIVWN
jgi:DNA adenine methylase